MVSDTLLPWGQQTYRDDPPNNHHVERYILGIGDHGNIAPYANAFESALDRFTTPPMTPDADARYRHQHRNTPYYYAPTAYTLAELDHMVNHNMMTAGNRSEEFDEWESDHHHSNDFMTLPTCAHEDNARQPQHSQGDNTTQTRAWTDHGAHHRYREHRPPDMCSDATMTKHDRDRA